MSNRKLPEGFIEKLYIDGFLNDNMERREVDYGYVSNHLLATSGRKRNISSSFETALQKAEAK